MDMENKKTNAFNVTFPTYKGILLPDFPELMANTEQKMAEIKIFPSRETDILLCGPMKCGTHWLLEIMVMLLSGECKNTSETVIGSNIEFNPLEKTEKRSDPRILQTHLPYKFLPTKHLQNKYKIVFILRNPKDRITSLYHMAKGARPELDELPWSHFFSASYIDRLVPELYGSWFDYMKEWEEVLQLNPDHIFVIHFEDLKRDFKTSAKKLGEFLGVERNSSFFDELEEKCSFALMKKTKPVDLYNVQPGTVLYRKGVVGDWKNLFTVAQNEAFDAVYQKEMADSKLSFKYE